MKTRILSLLAALAAFFTVVGGLDLSGLIDLMPKSVATVFATALPALALVVHLVKALGDSLDDGQINGSFKIALLGLICGGCLLMPSCAGIGSAITGQPIPTTPVKREDGSGPSFELATSDLLKAEQDALLAGQTGAPPKAWGAYDAGLVAAKAREVINSGK